MKCVINQKQFNLTKNDFIASGGEGDIYVKNTTAFKIYHDPNRMMPLDKISELSSIQNTNIIRPQDIINSEEGAPIGYTMRYIPQSYVLCELFTKAFRTRNNLSHQMMQDLIKKLHEIVSCVHSANILIVDLNEMNFLASKDLKEIYAIDTDSYQTKSFRATAIMDSIRDRHSSTFSRETDWFSYGIISFQMFTGIHPYKGNHPTVKNINDRMLNNISVFNKDVSVPAVCFPFDIIPQTYKDWYKAVFDDGKRLPPPISFEQFQTVITTLKTITSTDKVEITLIKDYDSDIIDVFYSTGIKVMTSKSFYLSNKHIHTTDAKVFKTKSGTSILAKIKSNKLTLLNTDTGKEINCDIFAESLMQYDNNLYVKALSSVTYIEAVEIGNNIIASVKTVANVLENSSRFFDGVLVQNIVGSLYFSIFDKDTGYQVRINELDGLRVIDAKHDSKVLMVIVSDNVGNYYRKTIRFNDTYTSYDIRSNDVHNLSGVNFTTLENGICICVNEDEFLEIFSNKINSNTIKIVQDKTISPTMKLFKSGNTLMFANGNSLYSAKLK